MFLNSPLDVFDETPSYLLQVAAALGFALAWSATRGRGPLERVVTALTHRARRAVDTPTTRPTDPSTADPTESAGGTSGPPAGNSRLGGHAPVPCSGRT